MISPKGIEEKGIHSATIDGSLVRSEAKFDLDQGYLGEDSAIFLLTATRPA